MGMIVGTIPSTPITVGGVMLDTAHRKLKGRKGEIILEGSRQTEILHILMRRADNLVSFGELFLQLYGNETIKRRNSLKTFIHHLSRHLKDVCDDDVFIESIRGKGYVLRMTPPF